MKLNQLLKDRGVKIPRGVYIYLHLHADPLPEIGLCTTTGDTPLKVCTTERLQRLIAEIDQFRREIIEIAICGMPLAQLILSPDRPRREVIANLEYQHLLALQKIAEHVLVNFGIEGDELSGKITARLVLEVEHRIRYLADEDVHAPSDACERVKAALLAHHVKSLNAQTSDNPTIQ